MRLSIQLAATAAAMVWVGCGVASAQGYAGEYIVGAQVVSDEVVGGDAVVSGDGVVAGAVVMGGAVPGVPRVYGQPDLFYNYYTQGYANAVNAQMYVAPLPVPPNVGHTFYTYQPFMPHEMLYWHKDRYHNYYDGGRGLNRTRATYYAPPVRTSASNFYWNVLRIPR